MKNYYGILRAGEVFHGFSDEELDSVLAELRCKEFDYLRGGVIFGQGEIVKSCGVILSGSIVARSVSYGGEQRVISVLSAGEVFGDVLMSSGDTPTPVEVSARESSSVIFLPLDRLAGGDALCSRVLVNLMHGISRKFWLLNRKIAYLSAKSMRAKIAMFLLDQQRFYGSPTFYTGYTRNELASLLCVNRSALSRELSRMSRDGLISCCKSSFKIESPEGLKKCL